MMVSSMHAPPPGTSPHYAPYRPGPIEPRFDLSRNMDLSSHDSTRKFRPIPIEGPSSRSQPASSTAPEDGRSKPFLPSISNLLGIADGDRPRHELATSNSNGGYPDDRHYMSQNRPSPREPLLDPLLMSKHSPQDQYRPALSPASSYRSDTPVDNSASSNNTTAASSMSSMSISALNSANPSNDSLHHHHPNHPHHHQRASSACSDATYSPLPIQTNFTPTYPNPPSTTTTTTSATSPYQYSPSTASTSSAHSPVATNHPAPAYYTNAQSSLPLPPPPPPSAAAAAAAVASQQQTNPWQHQHHHHYINASSQSSLSQSQERYVCHKCQKAFSRPSSLKIHSHSHTGEKPFICPYSGCGKSFSVRSNMRRHERGCHSPPNKIGRVGMNVM